MKITTVLAASAVGSLIAAGAFAQTMQPIPNPPEPEHPHHVVHHHHHVVHHHVVHHVHHVAKTGAAAPNAPQGEQHPK